MNGNEEGINLSGVEVITFDLDDTLWPVEPVIRHAEAVFFSWMEERAPEITRRYTPESLLQSRQRFMRAAPHREQHDLTRLRKNWLRELAAETGADADLLVTEGFSVFRRARNQVDPFPGTLGMLERLASRFIVGAISNGNADVFETPLAPYFSFSMPAAEAGSAKPERDIFDQAVRKAGVDHAAVLHIGDDPLCDVVGARRAGLQAAWFNPGKKRWTGGHEAPHWIVTGIDEIPLRLGL